MTTKQFMNLEINEESDFVSMDGYDDCIIGIVERFGQETIICYDKDAVLLKLQNDGMSYDEAEEFFYFNQIGSWVGEKTPCFLTVLSLEEKASLGIIR